jgi:hypothetical protein
MTYKAIRYSLLSGTKYNGKKYDVTDTSGIGKRCKSEGCRKIPDVCVICGAEGN